jgi:hypothetical protein
LRALPGLEAVTNVQTGTTPNFTNTVTFKGVRGNIAQLTSINALTPSGTITHATTTSGSNDVYQGGKALEFVGNSSELTSIYQEFDNGDLGTAAALSQLNQYAVNCWIKVDVVPAAGVLEIALVDGAGTIINDAQGVANSFTKSLPAATTGYLPLNGVFRTPAVMPTIARLRIRLTTALSTGSTLFIDELCFAGMSQSFQGGAYIACFAGNVPMIGNDTARDRWTWTLTNTAGLFQRLFDRFFAMKSLQLLLPSASSPSISDSLIS